ncbi:transforming growth factor-beta receptor-associated protein 1 [Pontoporia blainvillei]|uniref:Transforming growth factor-beta receptor-associated protein 1 n=1 Tax=Pontoporia blainvillei TaxID=48723 RepID=A0ABX0SA47_PONBL|nr:transforming growth factor-beta receptor-associated protein 1 [Pontoporia blainvillei]
MFLTVVLPNAYSAQNEDKMGSLQSMINKLLFFFQVGVQVFTKRPVDEQQSRFNPDDIISCLKKYPQALVKYLEHLVMDRRLQKEGYHTHLAVLYLDEVLQQRPSASGKDAEVTETQAKLRRLLQQSDLYQVHFLLDRIRGAGLPMESAILLGKLEQHEEALRILVHELADFPAAEGYCLWRSEGRAPPYRRRLFQLLLAIYLGAGPSAPELAMAAVDLLNRRATEFDAAQVLQLLPGTWSVQLLCPFLTGAMRDSIHARRTTQVAVGLAKSENLIYKYDKMKLKGSSVRLSDKKLCQMCQNPFCEPVFVSRGKWDVADPLHWMEMDNPRNRDMPDSPVQGHCHPKQMSALKGNEPSCATQTNQTPHPEPRSVDTYLHWKCLLR